MRGMVCMHGDADLLEVIQALSATSTFPCRLDGRQQDCHQDADDCDHDQQFHEGKADRRLRLYKTTIAVHGIDPLT